MVAMPTVRLSEEAHRLLIEKGRKGETFSDVIVRVLADLEESPMPKPRREP